MKRQIDCSYNRIALYKNENNKFDVTEICNILLKKITLLQFHQMIVKEQLNYPINLSITSLFFSVSSQPYLNNFSDVL